MRSTIVVPIALAMSCAQSARPPVATPIPVLPLPTPEAPSGPVALAPSASASASSGPPKFVPSETTTLGLPSSVACAFETSKVTSPIALRTRPKAGLFANVVSGAARLIVPKAGDPVVQVTRAGAELRGFVQQSNGNNHLEGGVYLRPSGPVVLSGVFSVAADAKIGWSGRATGALVPDVIGVDVFGDRALDATPCARFTLDTAKFDAKKLVPKGKFPPRVRLLTSDRPVPIAITATDPPIGTLAKRYGWARVLEIDSASGRSLFVLTLPQGVLFGWVASKDLEPDQKIVEPVLGIGTGLVGYGQKAISNPSIWDATCAHDVRLVADLSDGGTSAGDPPFTYVGVVRAGTSFRYRKSSDPLYELWGAGSVLPGITLVRGSLSVPVVELVDCARTSVHD